MTWANDLARTEFDVLAAQASLALDGLVPIERLSAYLIAVATHSGAPAVAPDVVERLGVMLHPQGSSALQLKLSPRRGKRAPNDARERITKRNSDFAKVQKVAYLRRTNVHLKVALHQAGLTDGQYRRLRREFSDEGVLCRWIVDLKNRNDAHVANMSDPRYARAHAEQLTHIEEESRAKI